ncbi:HIRA-interacting protein 3 [Scomber japonicus]|uniref:HIRA-interacting protein 3 n=1 Tax=Scomber japonicus TaxID=13676 RepID=UPI002305306E|nr:HIRA-interacting protein 3 [Scomber japonicus]
MKVSEKEAVKIHKFVCRQLHAEPDLSSLTLGILKKRYLAHVGCESLSSETRTFMKQVVQEELMKMQENGHDLETKMPQNKRKREEENDEVISERESEDESRAKKSRRQLSSSSESEDKEDHKTGSEESEEEEQIKTASGDEEQEVKKSNNKQQINSENSSDDEKNESKKSESESSCTDSPKAKVKTTPNTTKNGAKTSSSTSPGKKTPKSDEEDEADSESESEKKDKNNVNDSSDSEKEENVLVEKKTNGSDSDSDSSSLTSLEDEKGSGTGKEQNTEKKKTVEKKEGSKSQKNSDKTIARLKRYLSLCGVRRNYKKVLQDCRSARAMVAVLKKELENLGVQGNPSIKKCKDVKKKREQAQELAELDVSNIIATEGRPTRRGASVSKKQQNTPSSAYQRTLNSGSDSGEENTQKGHRRAIDWTNLKGIISDDADSA